MTVISLDRKNAAVYVALKAAEPGIDGVRISILSSWPGYISELKLQVEENLVKLGAYYFWTGPANLVIQKDDFPGKRKWYAPWKRHLIRFKGSHISFYPIFNVDVIRGTRNDILWLDWPEKLNDGQYHTLVNSIKPGGILVESHDG